MPRRRSPTGPLLAALGPVLFFLALMLVLLLWYFWPRGPGDLYDPSAQPRPITPAGDLAADEKATINLYKQTIPSVVHITTLALRQDFFTLDIRAVPEGTGSGFIWDKEGRVVTNFHVIRNADRAKVTLWDQTTLDAALVGAYPDKDLAVLKIDAPPEKLRPIPIGTSHDLQVGQKAFAIGNPFGLDFTLTTGIISALGREIKSVNQRTIRGVIQTDAAINPGNSGGPLLDSSGRLIGVNTAIYSPSGAYAGIGFAIPVDEVNRIVPQLIRYGRIRRPSIGIDWESGTYTRRLGLPGVLVVNVHPGGPAAKAGIRPTRRDRFGRLVLGDLIVRIDGEPVNSVNDLLDILERHQPGDTIRVTVQRDGELLELPVTLE